jgi:hypothetical protein
MAYKNIFSEKIYNIYMIDNIFHLLGGMVISTSTAGVLWHLIERKIIVLQDGKVFSFLVFGFLCFVVIIWEIFEYISFYPMEYMIYGDLIVDMIFGLIGGSIALFFGIRINADSQ